MKFGIVVDSGCDLREIDHWAGEDCRFFLVPLKLEVGEREFVDDASLDVEEFVQISFSYKGKTSSAAPSPGEWLEAFEAADCTIAITTTGTISGSYASAETAKKIALEHDPSKKIFIINTLSIGPEMSLLVRKTTELIKEGKGFEQIAAELTEYLTETRLLFILESMDNLIKNGRVSRLAGSIAGLLGIKILGRASDEGTLDLLHKKRGRTAVYDTCVQEMISRGFCGGRVIISHCMNLKKAEYIKEQLLSRFPASDVMVMPASGLISYYAERGGLLIGYEAKQEK